MSNMIITSVYGEFDHTYNLLQTYLLLLFFTLAYVLMDEGLQAANAEVRYYMKIRRDELERL